MSVAERTREAARENPFLVAGLRAGVVNHRAAAEFLDVEGETDAVATALRRFAETLPTYATEHREARVTMHSGVGVMEDAEKAHGSEQCAPNVGTETVLWLDDSAVVTDAGDRTAVIATGEVDTATLGAVLTRLAVADIDVVAAGVAADSLVVVVERRAGARTVRLVEQGVAAVPS